MNPKEMVVSIAAAMMIAAIFASSAMAITVDGHKNDWPADGDCQIVIIDGRDRPGIWEESDQYYGWTWDNGYDMRKVCVYFEGGNMYFRIDVDGCPGDTDGDCIHDQSTWIPPIKDKPGVGEGAGTDEAEKYDIYIDKDGDGDKDYRLNYEDGDSTLLTYPSDTVVGATTEEAYWCNDAGCVELSILDYSSYGIDMNSFCIYARSDNEPDLIGEDITDIVCYNNNPPEAHFSYTGTGCKIVTLNASDSWDSEGPIAKFEWDLDNNGVYEIDNGANPIYVANVATTGLDVGPNTIRLRVTDNTGQTDWTNVPQVIVTGDPTAIAKADGSHGPIQIPEGGKTVSFDGTASHADSPATLDLGDCYWTIKATTYPGLGPHNVFIDGDTTASLHVEDNYGCEDDDTVRVEVEIEREVPVLTPIGTVALIGLLGLIGVGIIMRRR